MRSLYGYYVVGGFMTLKDLKLQQAIEEIIGRSRSEIDAAVKRFEIRHGHRPKMLVIPETKYMGMRLHVAVAGGSVWVSDYGKREEVKRNGN